MISRPTDGSSKSLVWRRRIWNPAIANPTYIGGNPRPDAMASDTCGVNSLVDPSDLTLPDAPWADLCSVHPASELDGAGRTGSVTVTVAVAGFVPERVGSAGWTASMATPGCIHDAQVVDYDAIEHDISVRTRCGGEPPPCTGIAALITSLTGGPCASSGPWENEEHHDLPADSVTFLADAIVVELRAADLSPTCG